MLVLLFVQVMIFLRVERKYKEEVEIWRNAWSMHASPKFFPLSLPDGVYNRIGKVQQSRNAHADLWVVMNESIKSMYMCWTKKGICPPSGFRVADHNVEEM